MHSRVKALLGLGLGAILTFSVLAIANAQVVESSMVLGNGDIYVQCQNAGEASMMYNMEYDSLTLTFKKVGSPSGTLQIGFIGAIPNTQQLFSSYISSGYFKVLATQSVSALTTSFTDYTYTLSNGAGDGFLFTQGFLCLYYAGGNGSNHVSVQLVEDTVNPDGKYSHHFYSSIGESQMINGVPVDVIPDLNRDLDFSISNGDSGNANCNQVSYASSYDYLVRNIGLGNVQSKWIQNSDGQFRCVPDPQDISCKLTKMYGVNDSYLFYIDFLPASHGADVIVKDGSTVIYSGTMGVGSHAWFFYTFEDGSGSHSVQIDGSICGNIANAPISIVA